MYGCKECPEILEPDDIASEIPQDLPCNQLVSFFKVVHKLMERLKPKESQKFSKFNYRVPHLVHTAAIKGIKQLH